jgi:hypothetical protein
MKKLLFSTLAILGCAHYSLGQSVPSYVPATGLVGWWPFTGNALDSSGNGNHGTVIGAKLTNDRNGNFNKAYSFDGSNKINLGRLSIIDTLNATKDISYSLWIKADKNQSLFDKMPLLTKRQQSWVTAGYTKSYFTIHAGGQAFYSRSNKYICYGFIDAHMYTYGLSNGLDGGETDDDNWHHIIATKNINLYSLYFDGVLVDTTTDKTILYSTDSMILGYQGMWGFDSERWYKGLVDDIGIWNRALSACEISKLYLASNTFFTSKPANQAVKIGASASFTIKDTLGTSATYQWQENSGAGFVNLSNTSPYSGVNTKTLDINPVVAGMHNNQYRCIRNGGSSCLDTSAAAILTLSNLSIKANQVEGLTIRPNPVHNSLSISAPATINNLVLYNTLGQLIFESKPTTKTASIDMSVYPAGMYILKLNDEWVEKIIKE